MDFLSWVFRLPICYLLTLAVASPLITRPATASVTSRISCAHGSVGVSLDIDGDIDPASVEVIRNLFAKLHAQEAMLASGGKCDADNATQANDLSAFGDHYGINSRGGSIYAAMAIGRMLRRENAWIAVNGVCFSACVFILAGAVDRMIGESDQVGIHRPYLWSTPENPMGADQVMLAYSRTLQDMRSYLSEMNVSQRLANDMLATEPENNRILTEAELKAYRLTGVDPAEQQRRAIQKEAADIKEANELGLDRLEYTRRKSLGGILCDSLSTGDYGAFIACKRSILKHGNF